MRFAMISALLALIASAAMAQQRAVYIIYCTGKVTVKSGSTAAKGAIGMELHGDDLVTVPKGGSLQLSVDGRLARYDKAAKIKVADATRKVADGENPAVAKAAAALGVASLAPLSVTGDKSAGPVILEPRATAIPAGPIRFRWLHTAAAGSNYRVSVKNYLGTEVFTASTSDTAVAWNDAKLPADVIYTWTVTDATGKTTGSLFNRATDAADAALRKDADMIRKELGPTNPALPLMLSALYGGSGCYGQAVEVLSGATGVAKEHQKEMMIRVRDTYRLQMNMPDDEARLIFPIN